jgi:AraC-like DNA-binding protein
MPAGSEKDTVSMHFAAAAVAALPAEARSRVLREAGIPAELLHRPQARVTAEGFAALWLAVARERDDEFFGLDRRRMKSGTFGLLCRAALHGADLGRALRRLLRGYSLVFDDLSAELRIEQRTAVVEIHNRIEGAAERRFADETLLVLLHGTLCWLAGRRILLAEVAFAHPAPAHAAEYRAMFSQHLRFEAEQTAMRFDARVLKAAVVQTEASLKPFLRAAPQSVFLKYKDNGSWSQRVRHRLRSALGPGGTPAFTVVAREFGTAPTTLRRRLEAEGTTFQTIKDELRRDSAIHRLSHGSSSVTAIATELGFQEPSAFRRAFKKWTGVQPMHYRGGVGNDDAERAVGRHQATRRPPPMRGSRTQ